MFQWRVNIMGHWEAKEKEFRALGWLSQLNLSFSSDHDSRVLGSSPALGFMLRCIHVYVCAVAVYVCVSQINK